MSHNKIREDKTCLNCRHVVEQKFCPNCGQENSDSRKTFHHLFIHFFEDLTHYENAFWKTIRNLLFKPATLTKEYLSGKRLSYLAPVRLYIFISFITFLLIAIFPSKVGDQISKGEKEISTKLINQDKKGTKGAYKTHFELKTMKEIDSIQKYGKEDEKLSELEYWLYEKSVHVTENNSKREIVEKFIESFFHNIPKILFIIMPFFAFFLWIFHNKKKWYYFDHGIFTLHYFSFLLLIFLIMFIVERVVGLFGEDSPISFIASIVNVVGTIWMCYYFYPAHHRFYGESRIVSFVKSVILFFINFFFILFLLTFYVLYTFINLH
ncbi:DUF3667 domain-containing protein [Flavobacterium sp. WLB]|uniref:DUF3667 domain-containing protein n=1 Tax=Flavobacterium panici TaxID=2654843 RepID=A0A9N8J423_9FLAO|nr:MULTISPECIES: DUF3667 domain-containing protein [Flavobacterium]KOP38412.1 hypothetical protein AKO67_09410 [Flavobacterium sp. VMW]OWU89979.1 hypothetical protein APR43_14810 [Flavobacterium sp. NLM]PUU69383.1 DUF3667 domain-containing protein [Flavobacterium sp. WLB]CAC9975073.1 hypothetical protein FLAPXU55_02776 [Flavobacterium panici]